MMKQKVIFILLNEYTDWEGAFLLRGAERNVYDEMLDDCPLSR